MTAFSSPKVLQMVSMDQDPSAAAYDGDVIWLLAADLMAYWHRCGSREGTDVA